MEAITTLIRYDRLAIEVLQVATTVRDGHLSKGILDAGWGYFRRCALSFDRNQNAALHLLKAGCALWGGTWVVGITPL